MAEGKTTSLASLDELQSFIEKVRDGAARDAALRDSFQEVGQGIADILELLTQQGPETAKAIAAALRDLKMNIEVKPTIRIEVNPTPIEMKPVFNVPAQAAKGGWEFDCEPKPGGGFKIRATRTT